MQTEASLRQDLLRTCHVLYRQGLVAGRTVRLRAASLKRHWESVEDDDVPHTDLPPVATSDLPQPVVDSDPFENRRRLIDPNGLYGI